MSGDFQGCEAAALRISNIDARDMGKIPSQRALVAEFNPEWAYAHHAYIEFFNDRWYIAWSSGKVNEDDLGQRIMYAVSDDFLQWSEPKILMDSTPGWYSDTVLSCYGFYKSKDRLYIYITMQEFLPSSLRENGMLRPEGEDSKDVLYRYRYMKSTTDGENWSEAIHVTSGGGTQYVTSGANKRRFFFDMTDAFYNDDGNAAVWNISGLSEEQIIRAGDRGASLLCEAAGYMTPDGTMHMLNRSNAGRLWHSQSQNNGETWGESYPTNFLVESSQFNVGRLPDGRYYIVCNSKKHPCWDRIPLLLYISEDGYIFDKVFTIRDERDYRQQKLGMYKGGYFAYPTTVIRNGYMYICYTKQKETVEVTRIALSDIL